MEEVIMVENIVTMECRRVIHLMSNGGFAEDALASYGAPEGTQAQIAQEAGAWHLRAEWPYKGVLNIEAEGWPQAKKMVAWSFMGCVNMTEAFMHASIFFEELFRQKPQYGFVRKLPSGVENGRETGPLLVFEAEWMLEKAVAVGG